MVSIIERFHCTIFIQSLSLKMAHESSRSAESKILLDEVPPLSPHVMAARLKGKAFSQSIVDFDLDEEDYFSTFVTFNNSFVQVIYFNIDGGATVDGKK